MDFLATFDVDDWNVVRDRWEHQAELRYPHPAVHREPVSCNILISKRRGGEGKCEGGEGCGGGGKGMREAQGIQYKVTNQL